MFAQNQTNLYKQIEFYSGFHNTGNKFKVESSAVTAPLQRRCNEQINSIFGGFQQHRKRQRGCKQRRSSGAPAALQRILESCFIREVENSAAPAPPQRRHSAAVVNNALDSEPRPPPLHPGGGRMILEIQ